MAVLKLPRLQTGTAIVDHANGKPITALTRFWDAAMSQIEDNLNAVIAAQGSADGAAGAAAAAQASADAAQATADALDAALDVAAGKILHILNTMTLAGIDGSALNIGTGGTLGSAAFNNTGTSGANVPLLNGTNTWANAQTFALALLTIAGVLNAANDAAAAGLGVPVGGIYRNGSVLMVRVT